MSSYLWDKTLQEGLMYGWLPAGAKKATGVEGNCWKNADFPGGYLPEEFQWGKVVTDEDAIGLANGLQNFLERQFRLYRSRERAIQEWVSRNAPLLLKEGMSANLLIDANRSWSIEFIEDFSKFLRDGGFVFYWDE